tara:strand:- start:21097 stop:21948 length:852 start_codon:yes stop_codon:yes gene_type:complete
MLILDKMTFISFVVPNNKYIPISLNSQRHRTSLIKNEDFLTGIEIGIPLNIFSNIFTNLHYGYDVTNWEVVFMQFVLGFYTYGKDRYYDALEYKKNPYNTSKVELYENIYNSKEVYISAIYSSYLLFSIWVLMNDNILLPYILLLYLNGEYKLYKKYLGVFKPAYIGFMWTMSSVILPCIVNDNSYDIFKYPADYLPCFLILFATSSFADNKDISDDIINNVETIPVKYGIEKSNFINMFALIVSSILLVENPNFENRILVNSLVEVQNFVTMGLLYNSTFNN